MKKVLVNPESTSILINADKCFQVDLKTVSGNEILVNATIDGEYRKDLVVLIEEEGTNVLISADFQPNFVNPNDKLSAHKVLSISLEIVLPEYVDAHLFGTNTNVLATGHYRKLKIDLSDGTCTLENVSEKVSVKTQSGTIFLKAASGTVDAKSQYGQVLGKSIVSGDNYFDLHSIEGDIHIMNTE
ncbi:DUF4097 family beta strand repeat-containing protein [Allomuricauda sp. d1]|uniref:DUF4097 family beta strand repeat-containing protein n=1 Tax=Allomuricauda sp. d1 TaxID=3136725 RepID=UPI0031DA3CF8